MHELQPAPKPFGSTASTLVENVWEQHGAALYVLARVVLNDAHDAERVVAQAILDACKPDQDPPVEVDRRTLARYVLVLWARRQAELGAERVEPTDDGRDADSSGVAVMSALSYPERSAIAWGLLGAHTYTEIAAFLGMPPDEVAALMRSGLMRMRDDHERPTVEGH